MKHIDDIKIKNIDLDKYSKDIELMKKAIIEAKIIEFYNEFEGFLPPKEKITYYMAARYIVDNNKQDEYILFIESISSFYIKNEKYLENNEVSFLEIITWYFEILDIVNEIIETMNKSYQN